MQHVLTDEERQVLDLLIDGNTERRIASILDVGHRTVERRLAAIRRKLGARTTLAAAVIYARMSITADEPVRRS